MSHSIRNSAPAWTLLAILAALPGCPRVGHFTYEMPKFGANLSAANFEYIKFGVVGSASIKNKVEHMINSNEIGLVNEALAAIYAQLPTGEPIALVNVVVDISKKTTESNVMGQSHTSVEDDFLAIRADVVKFTGVADREGSSPSRPKSEAHQGARLRFFDRSEQSVREIAAMASARMRETGRM
jgi:hypothetical protein